MRHDNRHPVSRSLLVLSTSALALGLAGMNKAFETVDQYYFGQAAKSDNVTATQARPDAPVDCRKTPNDLRCRPIGRAGFTFPPPPMRRAGSFRSPPVISR